MDYQDFTSIERQRRILRIVLFVIILGTLPFYCAGFLLLGTSPQQRLGNDTPLPSLTPLQNAVRTNTPFPTPRLPLTITQLSPLRPTPLQFNPIPGVPVVPTSPIVIVPPTVFIPPNTAAPTLTPFPTQVPPTAVPTVTETPLPTDIPLPTATFTETPTETPADAITTAEPLQEGSGT